MDTLAPNCPRCGGEMWDNREKKLNPKAPDFRCKNKQCIDPKTGFVTATWLTEPKEEPKPLRAKEHSQDLMSILLRIEKKVDNLLESL